MSKRSFEELIHICILSEIFTLCQVWVQCWFKLSGQNEQNLNFQTRFSQIGLRLDKKGRGQKLLRISPELIWCHFFSEILNINFNPKMGHFGFFQLIKNYTETTLLIDMKIISQEASYAAQQSLNRVKSPKICANCLKFILNRDSGFYVVKITFIDYRVKIFSLLLVFEDLTLVKICETAWEASCDIIFLSINKVVSA